MIEMVETAFILNNMTEKSLILLDEIGRGTAPYDGLSLAWSITEYLHNTKAIAARTLFAPHYHELTDLEHTLDRVENYHVAVKEFGDKIIFLRQIMPGPGDKSYGIHVAELAGIPQPVIHRSREILNELNENPHENVKASSRVKKEFKLDLFSKKQSEIFRDLKSL